MEDIKTRLRKYRANCARLSVLELEIGNLEHKIREFSENPPRAPYEPKAVPGGNAQSYNDMPRSQVLYGTLDGKEGFDPTLQLRTALKTATSEVIDLGVEVSKIEAALKALDTSALLVVMQTYMDNKSWREISQKIESEFGYHPCESWVTRTRKKALEALKISLRM